MKRRYSWFLWICLAALLIGGAGFLGQRSAAADEQAQPTPPATIPVTRGEVAQTISAPGELVASQVVRLGMGADGPLAEIMVKPGDAVSAGQILARLGNRMALAAQVTNAQQGVLEARQARQELLDQAPSMAATARQRLVAAAQELDAAQRARLGLNNPRADDSRLEKAQAEYILADRQLIAADKEFRAVAGRSERDPERALALLNLGRARQQREQVLATLNWLTGEPSSPELEAAEARLGQALAEQELAQREWERLKDGIPADELALAESRIASAEAALQQAEAGLQALELRAPFDGIILEVSARTGEWVNGGEGFIVLSDPQALEIQASIVEEAYPQAKSGMKVEVFLDAFPEAPLRGTLTRIVPQRLPGDRPLYPVFIQLEQVPNGLAPGMTVDAAIQVDQRENVLRLPRAAVRAGSQDEVTVKIWQDGRELTRTIRIGLRGDLYVEILEGLQEGEEVIGL